MPNHALTVLPLVVTRRGPVEQSRFQMSRWLLCGTVLTALSGLSSSLVKAQTIISVQHGADGVNGSTPWIGSNHDATAGQNGLDINLSPNLDTDFTRQSTNLVDLETFGGIGGRGSATGPYHVPGAIGGWGGNIDVNPGGVMHASGDQSTTVPLIKLLSQGGDGGDAQHGVGRGGDGSQVTVQLDGKVATKGQNFVGIEAISQGGNAGTGGTIQDFVARDTGGMGGAVTIDVSAMSTVATQGNGAAALVMESLGGNGSNRGRGAAYSDAYVTNGGDGGAVTLHNHGSISTLGDDAIAVLLQSVGGVGGTQGDSGGSDGAQGGAGGAINVTQDGAIATTGDASIGLLARSVGGSGGAGAGAVFTGGDGGSAGSGGIVTIDNTGTISTEGANSDAILAQSVGGGSVASIVPTDNTDSSGGGGDGGRGGLFIVGGGGNGGSGGSGGSIVIRNEGTIKTAAESAAGVAAQSIGGGGGDGGAAANISVGVITLSLAVGGAGGDGGSGGDITLTNDGGVTTAGTRSDGLAAYSIGGGGGIGGSADALAGSIGTDELPSIAISYAVGGSGGGGGHGGTLSLSSAGSITTTGDDAAAIRASSIGGGGGSGGDAGASSLAASLGEIPSLTLSAAVGGKGGGGGGGGMVTVSNTGLLTTSGADAAGIAASSIGGGGGEGGESSAYNYTFSRSNAVHVGVAVGGSGGNGGNGGSVTATNSNGIATSGFAASGIYAASIGGGGGDGGAGEAKSAQNIPVAAAEWIPLPFEQTGTLNVSVGGSGGSGGSSDAVNVTNTGSISTEGGSARGIFAQSIGGGGGVAATGSTEGSSDLQVNVSVGGSGGGGGNGNIVKVDNAAGGSIVTMGDDAHGIEAQSVGGGGGSGGSAAGGIESSSLATTGQTALKTGLKTLVTKILPALAKKYSVEAKPEITGSLQVAVGGTGGAAGDGGLATVTNEGAIATSGTGAYGILAQSIGGGGGDGGAATSDGGKLINMNVTVGGAGGSSGNGSAVSLSNDGTISTAGGASLGLAAQSIGGGGGLGAATYIGDTLLGVPVGNSFKMGNGGAGDGGTVSVTNSGSVTTQGNEAHGLLAQSIGGGGGLLTLTAGGVSASSAASAFEDPEIVDLLGQVKSQLATMGIDADAETAEATQQEQSAAAMLTTINLDLGTDAGSNGAGGSVSVIQTGGISTSGANAFGLVAQSIGGGGGLGTGAFDTQASLALSGQLGGGTGNGSSVTLDLAGRIATSGKGAVGILAQSIGGGGGYTGSYEIPGTTAAFFLTASNLGRGAGGLITIENVPGSPAPLTLATIGTNAHAIVAQSLSDGGGAVSSADGIVIPGTTDMTARNGTADGAVSGGVIINLTGRITASGVGADGIYTQSGVQGTNGNIISAGGPIDITLNGSAAGGSGSGAAIQIDGGDVNKITLSKGTVEAASGTAIIASGGSVFISNSGTLIGDVVTSRSWGDDHDTLDNTKDGVFVTGNRVDMNGGFVINQGTIALGKYGTYGTTSLNGNYSQVGQGELITHIDFLNRLTSVLQVSGTASLGGTLRVDLESPAPGAVLPVIEAAQGVTGTMAASTGLLVYSYATTTTANALMVGLNADFKPAGTSLNTDQTSVANALQQEWDQGGSDSKYQAFTKVLSVDAYYRALNQLTPSATSSPASHATDAAQKFMTNMMSCPYFPGQDTMMREGDCSWMRVTGGHARQTAINSDVGYSISDVSYQVGGQKHVSPDWILGGSVAYGNSWYNASDNLSGGAGQDLSAGLAVKYQPGRWLFAGALDGGVGWYHNSRDINFDDVGATAHSHSLLEHVSGRFRPSYQLLLGQSYLRLYSDFDATWAHMPHYTERDAGTYDLTVCGASQVTATASPTVELGSRIHRLGLDLKPYVAIGLTARSNDGWVTRARFADDQLSLNDFDDVTRLPQITANGIVGVDLLQTGGFEIKGYYSIKATGTFLAQEGSMRLGYRF